jgi:type II restriction/modification system DNA methylase subunit YeeA
MKGNFHVRFGERGGETRRPQGRKVRPAPTLRSGNFLYVALKQLLDLWKEVSVLASELGLPLMSPLPTIAPSPAQLHGIEINAYAHELAQATIWIGYIQWLRENGFREPSEPILKPIETILQMDAILDYDEQEQPVEPEWPQADVVIGNPPFLGGKKMRTELGDEYVDLLFQLHEGRVPHECDLVCYWFEQARAMIAEGRVKRAGLLATQGIRGGANRKVLERIKQTGDIFWAQSDRDWILDGAAVNVSMIGFDDGSEAFRVLDDIPVSVINADLTSSLDLTTAKSLQENAGLAFMGDTKGGSFDVRPDVAAKMLNAPLNPNGRPNSDVLHPWINAWDVTRRPRGMWIIDFGVDMPEDEAALYEAPFEHVLKHVRPKRLKNKRAAYRERWWIHAEPRPAMRAAIARLRRYIVTPRVSKYRLFVWISPNTLADSATIAIARDDDYFLSVLHSKPHELWALRQGTALEDRPRYTPTTTFETFPFPWPPGQEPKNDPRVEAIAKAARELVEKRDAWLNPEGATEKELKKRTLTNLYNERPTWLDLAHRKLDEAVLDAYGWPHDLSDEEILARLLALNLERAAASFLST